MSSKEYFSKERYPPYLYYCNHAIIRQGDAEERLQQGGSENATVFSPKSMPSNITTKTDNKAVGGIFAAARRRSSARMTPVIEKEGTSNATRSHSNSSKGLLRGCLSSPNCTSSNNDTPSIISATSPTFHAPSPAIIPPQITAPPSLFLTPSEGYNYERRFLFQHDEIPLFTPTWRLKERMKTVGICLVLALNIGTDPPDTYKPTPCAKLQTWLDPTTISRSKARERIAERLEAQYAKWQQRAKLKCKRALDPTMEEVRALCYSMRRNAKNDRVLLHYNGHGVPRCTANGEIWLFDKNHTQYIPLSVLELKSWLGKPSVIVLDCSNAGVLVPFFVSNTSPSSVNRTSASTRLTNTGRQSSNSALTGAVTEEENKNDTIRNNPLHSNTTLHQEQNQQDNTATSEEDQDPYLAWAANAVREYIVFAPCAEGQILPMNPDYPADLFTSCLTTPIPVALRWFIRKNPLSMEGVNPDVVDSIPGKLNDRKTPLGELNWIFTAITDTIAWNVLPSCLFQRLFRQDLLVASLFRNFLLADRIFRSFKCNPVSYPAIPTSTWNHPLWEAWDLSVETCLYHLLRQGNLGPATWGLPTTNDAISSETSASGINATCSAEDDDNLASGTGSPAVPQSTPSPPPQPQVTDAESAMASNVTSPFFSEQLTAFELWVEFAVCRYGDTYCMPKINPKVKTLEEEALEMKAPEQLPVVLQVLLSQAHRVRALVLLRRFLDLGPYAVNLALSVGIFPYVLKLLQSHIDEYKHVLVGIWAKILAFDPSCRIDLVKDGALSHFIDHLYWGLSPSGGDDGVDTSKMFFNGRDAAEQRTMAAFILSSICFDFPAGKAECLRQNLHIVCCDLLLVAEKDFKDATTSIGDENGKMISSSLIDGDDQFTSVFRMWLCICLGNMLNEMDSTQSDAFSKNVHLRLFSFLQDNSPEVRSAVAFSLGALIGRNSTKHFGAGSAHFPSRGSAPLLIDEGNSSIGVPQPFHQTNTIFQPQNLGMADGETFNILGDTFAEMGGQPSLNPEDRMRLSMDLAVAKKLATSTSDASPVVRYETILALGCCVEKYLPVFAEVANNNSMGLSPVCDEEMKTAHGTTFIPSPLQTNYLSEIGLENAKDFRFLWSVIRDLQHRDPFPIVSDTAKIVVSVVYEYVLMLYGGCVETLNLTTKSRIQSMADVHSGSVDQSASCAENITESTVYYPNASSVGTYNAYHPREISNEISLSKTYHGLSVQDSKIKVPAIDEHLTEEYGAIGYQSQYKLPCSQYFLWLRSKFGRYQENEQVFPCRYVERRNALVQKHIRSLAERFEILSHEISDTSKRKSNTGAALFFSNSGDFFSDLETEEEEAARAAALDAEISSKKKALQMEQSTLLHNEGCAMSTMLAFHPYEPALIVCDASDVISLWDINEAKKSCSFPNGNDKESRMTSTTWINEDSKSLLITGANDGSLRIWQGLIRDDWTLSKAKPTLVSAFVAEPDIQSEVRGSGLVMEWQQCTGQLVTAGSSSMLRCWDVETEKCFNEIDRNCEACVTALSTAWDPLFLSNNEKSFSGFGPSILVAGYGDGSIRIFDTRINYRPHDHSLPGRRKKIKLIQFHEHSSWIVNTCFTGFGSKYEVSLRCS